MAKHWTPLAVVWFVLAIAGLVLSAVFNTLSVVQARNFFADWVGSGPAVTSLTVDLLVVAVAGSILVIVEARRLGMRLGWLYLVISGVTAFAFGFPLFLAMRERHITAARSIAQKRDLDL